MSGLASPGGIPSPTFNYSNVNDSVVQQDITYNVNVNKEANQTNPILLIVTLIIILPWIIYFITDPNPQEEDNSEPDYTEEMGISFSSISAGSDHTCAVENSGSVYCWGFNKYGQVGKGFPDEMWESSFNFNPSLVRIDSDETATHVVNGDGSSCLILDTLELLCWGHNNRGQIGDYSTFDSYSPMTVGFDKITSVSDVALGFQFTCAIENQGDVYCWGNNNYGQSGAESSSEILSPNLVLAADGDPTVYLSTTTSSNFICALKYSGTLFCWGDNSNGQLGTTTDLPHSNEPQLIQLEDNLSFEQIDVGPDYVCGISNNSQLYCWGSNSNGKLGIGSDNSSSAEEPQLVVMPDNNQISKIALAWDHSCAIDKGGNILCWGGNSFSQLGVGNQLEVGSPVYSSTPSNSKATEIFLDGWRSCAQMSDNSLYCWGDNTAGQIGDGSYSNRLQPTRTALPAGEPVTGFSMSYRHSCAILNQTSIWCWGVNGGLLGDGERQDSNQPLQILPEMINENFEPEPTSKSDTRYWILIPSSFSILGMAALVYFYKVSNTG